MQGSSLLIIIINYFFTKFTETINTVNKKMTFEEYTEMESERNKQAIFWYAIRGGIGKW